MPGIGVNSTPGTLRAVWSSFRIDINSARDGDRLAAYYETVTKHNLNYRRYYHQFDY